MKQIIAVDIDDVLSLSVDEFVNFSNQRWGTNLSADDYEEDWVKVWGVNVDEAHNRAKILHEEADHESYKDIKGAKKTLLKLVDNYQLVCVTSRRRVLLKKTTNWINAIFPDVFSGIYFADIWNDKVGAKPAQLTKANILLEIGASYLIDDQPKHCTGAAEVGVKSLLFGDYAWTKTADLSKDIVRVKDWQEVAEYFGV